LDRSHRATGPTNYHVQLSIPSEFWPSGHSLNCGTAASFSEVKACERVYLKYIQMTLLLARWLLFN
jgi:hypothetical protein